jgi:protein-S-isoprenylcysteine O-methyltransferase Ste14
MYLGLALAQLGWVTWLAAPAALLAPLLFVAYITRWQILPEERALTARFGGAFADYRRRTRRWL